MRIAAYASYWRRFILALLMLMLAQAAGASGLDPALLAPFSAADTQARLHAISQLGQSRDPLAAAVLEALDGGTLSVTAQGRILIAGSGQSAMDPATGEKVTLPADADTVIVNNRLRRAVEGALAQSRLFSVDRAVRLAAARRMQQSGEAAQVALIAQALTKETDPQVRGALQVAQATLELKSAEPATREHAVTMLGRTANAEFRPVLVRLLGRDAQGAEVERDAGVRAAAALAIKDIDRHTATLEWLGNLFYGLSLGSVLLLAALGLAITFGLMGVINMAHGELLMIGAYVTYVVQWLFQRLAPGWLDWYVVAALPVAFLVTAAVGMALERTVIRWLYGRPLETLLATWGISLILMQTVRTIFGAQNVEVSNPSWMSGGVTVLGGLVLSYNRIAIIVFAMLVVVFVWLLLNHTRLGLFVRAITQNRRMADCVGVPTGRVDMLAFGLGSGIAGLAGIALSQLGNVGPDLGQGYIVDSFMVVVLGGVGQLAGTVIAALGLGGIDKFLEPYAGAVMAKIAILMLIVLVVQKRPQGLFAPRGRSVE
ncbi:urea ABC transporter permease subunit UrtB [Paralcaligenes ureilyticus]|uniref:Amino acid/amide ABC transporter membrane protein 1 (HAAT family) n=1 Tax=Paralcaligenes ureilyticus TaxID=627131 RepID=A0A4V2UY22_9BURK|nr:urea ABC transporter permease subunit UrtB [Paralcaligenes ureilyticus]TCT05718.1 amino acid/amide ABC transporter membrane protein 1 (HAAT family) [Paralcaligenes ureilyticus]